MASTVKVLGSRAGQSSHACLQERKNKHILLIYSKGMFPAFISCTGSIQSWLTITKGKVPPGAFWCSKLLK